MRSAATTSFDPLTLLPVSHQSTEATGNITGPFGELVANERVIETYLGKGFRL